MKHSLIDNKNWRVWLWSWSKSIHVIEPWAYLMRFSVLGWYHWPHLAADHRIARNKLAQMLFGSHFRNCSCDILKIISNYVQFTIYWKYQQIFDSYWSKKWTWFGWQNRFQCLVGWCALDENGIQVCSNNMLVTHNKCYEL